MNYKKVFFLGLCFLFIFVNQGFSQNSRSSTSSTNVKILENVIYSPYSSSSRSLRIYLPPSYYVSDKRYPVLYLMDGQNLFDDSTSYAGEWGIDEHLDTIIANGGKELIAVGVDNHGVFRMQEYNIYYNMKFGQPMGELFVDLLVKDIKSYIDANFRTLVDRANTTIIGSSMGGLMAYYALNKYPEVFSKAGVYSPSFWVSNAIFELHKENRMINDIKIHMIMGSEEGESMVTNFEKMKGVLEKNLPAENLRIKLYEGENHSESFWSRVFPDSYSWFYKNP